MEEKKNYMGLGDYVLITEQAPSHKLEIGKIVYENWSGLNSMEKSHSLIMFSDGSMEKFPIGDELEQIAKLLVKGK